MADNRVPTAPCAKCGRPVAETAKRCIYCGTARFKSAPGTPERAAEEAAALEDEKKLKRQAALYRAGVGVPKGEPEAEGGAGGLLKALLMLFVNPFATFKMLRRMFKP
jgi:hypothetical protein